MVKIASKAFRSRDPVRTMALFIISGIVALVVSSLAVRTFLAVAAMAASGEAKAFGAVWADPLDYGPTRFFVASALGALGGAVSYVRDQNTKAWETASVRAFTGHMIVAQFAAVLGFLLAVYLKLDNVLLLASTGFAGYLGDKFLDRADPVIERLMGAFSPSKSGDA